MAKKKITDLIGVKIRGYGILNEYGEYTFIPEEKGAHADRMKILFVQESSSVKETKKHLLISLKVAKGKKMSEVATKIYEAVNAVIIKLKEYEI